MQGSEFKPQLPQKIRLTTKYNNICIENDFYFYLLKNLLKATMRIMRSGESQRHIRKNYTTLKDYLLHFSPVYIKL